jgi:hypothetical protein
MCTGVWYPACSPLPACPWQGGQQAWPFGPFVPFDKQQHVAGSSSNAHSQLRRGLTTAASGNLPITGDVPAHL